MPAKNGRKPKKKVELADRATEGAAVYRHTAVDRHSKSAATPRSEPVGGAADTSTIQGILRTTDEYALQVFPADLIGRLQITTRGGKSYLTCLVRKTEKRAHPEEIIRQLYILTLVHKYHYPLDRIRVEKDIYIGSTVHDKAADIVVIAENDPNRDHIAGLLTWRPEFMRQKRAHSGGRGLSRDTGSGSRLVGGKDA